MSPTKVKRQEMHSWNCTQATPNLELFLVSQIATQRVKGRKLLSKNFKHFYLNYKASPQIDFYAHEAFRWLT